MNNNWSEIYKSGKSIRRWPSEDVVRLSSLLKEESEFIVDFGTGTGRNLVPLMLRLKDEGILMAIDIAIEGIRNIEVWCKSIGGKLISKQDADFEQIKCLEHRGVNFEEDIIYLVPTNSYKGFKVKTKVPKLEEENNIYLVLRKGSMEDSKIKFDSVDGFINRGSIFYMNREEVRRSIENIYNIVKKDGKGLISFKSMEDSRFTNRVLGERINENEVIITSGTQTGMKMLFFDKEDIINLLKDFHILDIKHNIEKTISLDKNHYELTFADYIVYVEPK